MEALILLVLVLIALPPAAIAALVWVWIRIRAVERRVDDLEASTRGQSRRPAPQPPPARPPAAPAARTIETAPPARPVPTTRVERAGPAAASAAPARPAARRARPSAAASGPGLEERLGARLPVWIAAVALTLSGVFLVKWSFDRGLLGPPLRVGLGTAFGLGLLGFGQLTRRRLGPIAAATVAAGIGVLYASFLAGTSLYDLIPVPVGFLLVAVVTLGAVALSLRHGPIIALVGMVGGFITPALIGADEPRPAPLFAFLLLLQLGLLLTIRRHDWWSLAPLAAGGSLAWVGLWLARGLGEADVWVLGPFLVATLALAVFARAGDAPSARGESIWSLGAPGRGEPSPAGLWVAAPGAILLAAEMARTSRMDPTAWGFFAILGIGCMLVAHVRPRFEPLAWLAPAFGAILLAFEGARLPRGAAAAAVAAAEGRFALTAAVIGTVFAGGATILAWFSERPARRATLAAATAAAYVLVAYVFLDGPSRAAWGLLGALLALLFAIAAVLAAKRFAGRAERDGTLAALIAASGGAAAFGLAAYLERASIGVAWSLEAVILAALFLRYRLDALRAVTAVVGLGVALRLLANPFVLDYPVGPHPLFNWLPYGYGVPIAAAIGVSVLLRAAGGRTLPLWFDGGACALSFALLTLMTRHAWHERADALDLELMELATLSIGWLALAGAFFAGSRLFPATAPVTAAASRIAALAGGAATLLGSGVALNPTAWRADVGDTPIINRLLVVYGVPAALLGALAAAFRRAGDALSSRVAGGAAVIALFLLVTLEVRQAFRGSRLDVGSASNGEMYAYSAAWLLFGLALLAAGIARRSLALRYASLAVMSLTVVKVFLVDTGELRDLYRVLSYFGLGVCLLLLAWVYQQFVVGSRTR